MYYEFAARFVVPSEVRLPRAVRVEGTPILPLARSTLGQKGCTAVQRSTDPGAALT